MDEKGVGRAYHDFPSKICCLTITKKFVREPFCVSECFWCRNLFFGQKVRGRVYHDFLWKKCCLTVTKKFVRGPFCASENFWCRKTCMDKRRRGKEAVSQFSVGTLLSHSAESFIREALCVSEKFCFRKNI